jgi:hypothetical protein
VMILDSAWQLRYTEELKWCMQTLDLMQNLLTQNSYVNIIWHPKYVMGTSEVFLYNAKYNVMKKKIPNQFFLQDWN